MKAQVIYLLDTDFEIIKFLVDNVKELSLKVYFGNGSKL